MRSSLRLHFIRPLSALTLVLIAVACSSRGSQPQPATSTSASTPPVINATATTAPSVAPSPTPAAYAPTPEPVADKNVIYQDDFSDPSTGWPSEKFDNYFTGYHEPDYYHIDVRSPNDQKLVTMPGKQSFDDVTIEAQVFTDPNNTAAEGDFRYGLAFRRSGSQFYAFTISPRTKQWFVLKSSPTALEVLKEGSDDSIQGLEAEDTLRVDVKGSTFFFHINDKLVDQVSDPDYASGEAGLFVQTFDITHVHAHFDSITIREVDAPQLICTVIAKALNVRSGPSTAFDPPMVFLPNGEQLEAQGRSPDGNWIRVRVEASGQLGWIYNSDRFVDCNIAIADLPVVEP